MNLDKTILILLFFLTYIIVIQISKKFQLYDLADSKRKIHREPALFTGGIGLLLTSFIILKYENYDSLISLLISWSFLLCVVGILDDLKKINIGSKLSLQILTIVILINEGLKISSLGFFFGYEIKLGYFSLFFTLICVLIIINGFNYIDGIDGLASSLFISSCFILYLLNSKLFVISNFLFYLCLSLIVFLIFNLRLIKYFPKCFLGNSGSLLVGYFIAFNLIYFSQKKILDPQIVIWSVALITYEFLSVNLSRVLKNYNPIRPGNDHIHYYFLSYTGSKYLTLIYLNLINISLGLIGIISYKFLGNEITIILFIILFFFYFYLREKIAKKKLKKI